MKIGTKLRNTEINMFNSISNYNIYPFFKLRVLFLNIPNLQLKKKLIPKKQIQLLTQRIHAHANIPDLL